MQEPCIAITMRVGRDPATGEIRDALSHEWYAFFYEIFPKGRLLPLPNSVTMIEHILEHHEMDGFILSGGNDIGEYTVRDTTEQRIIQYALDNTIPLIGVCRGLHMLCHAFGSTCIRCPEGRHSGTRHRLLVKDSSGRLMDYHEVNSFHNWGVRVDDVKEPLQADASSHDGFVEAISHNTLNMVAVQWHPEREKPFREPDMHLFKKVFLHGR